MSQCLSHRSLVWSLPAWKAVERVAFPLRFTTDSYFFAATVPSPSHDSQSEVVTMWLYVFCTVPRPPHPLQIANGAAAEGAAAARVALVTAGASPEYFSRSRSNAACSLCSTPELAMVHTRWRPSQEARRVSAASLVKFTRQSNTPGLERAE